MEQSKGRGQYSKILTLLTFCAFLLIAHILYILLFDTKRFPINTVKIMATYEHISHKQLETILEKYLNTSYFGLSARALTEELQKLEWIKQALVEKIWPDTLKITIEERRPIATWNTDLITAEGEVFKGKNAIDTLPHLYGPKNHASEVLQVYQKISKILSMYGLQAVLLRKSYTHVWELHISSGIKIRLGKQDLEKRLLRFCKAYPAVFSGKPEQVAWVDLRYARGMAVEWKRY
jgi:cell division protein FtsQ